MKTYLTLIPLVLALGASTVFSQQGPRRSDAPQRAQAQQQSCNCDCHLQCDGPRRGQARHQAQQRQQRQQRQQSRPSREQILKKFDTNGDGVLSREERAAVQAKRREIMLKRFDADSDGRLNESERAKLRKAIEVRRQNMSRQRKR